MQCDIILQLLLTESLQRNMFKEQATPEYIIVYYSIQHKQMQNYSKYKN